MNDMLRVKKQMHMHEVEKYGDLLSPRGTNFLFRRGGVDVIR